MPLVSEETTLSQACIAAQVLNSYANGAVTYTLHYGTRIDA